MESLWAVSAQGAPGVIQEYMEIQFNLWTQMRIQRRPDPIATGRLGTYALAKEGRTLDCDISNTRWRLTKCASNLFMWAGLVIYKAWFQPTGATSMTLSKTPHLYPAHQYMKITWAIQFRANLQANSRFQMLKCPCLGTLSWHILSKLLIFSLLLCHIFWRMMIFNACWKHIVIIFMRVF